MIPSTSTQAETSKVDGPSITRLHRWFRAYETNKKREMDEQQDARRYYHDKQWTDSEISKLNIRGQQATVRNRIKRKIDFLVGVEQRLRRDPKAFPRTPQHEHDADTATAALRFACDVNRWEKVSSDCMHEGLVPGIGAIFVGIEKGDPSLKRVASDRFFYDPRSVEPDFSDARYMGVHIWLDTDDAIARWPDYTGQLEAMMDGSSVGSAFRADADKSQSWGDFEHRRVRVVEFWDKRLNTQPMMDTTSMTPPAPQMGWYFTFFTGTLILDEGWSPYLDEDKAPANPYVAWSPYIDEKGDRYGMVRTMRSIQDEINYSASKILHRISVDRTYSQKGAVDDVDEFKRNLARPDGHAEVNGKWGEEVGVIDQRLQIQGEADRFQMAVTEIENLGPNPGLVGHGEGVDGASGRALLAQRDSGMTELSPIFERHRDWKLRVYRALWSRIRQAWTAERWIRVTDEQDSARFVGLNQYGYDETGALTGQNVISQIDVDIILNEGPDTITMNEELMQTLANIGEAAMGPLGKVMIELSNAPNKEKLLGMLDKATAPPPEVQAMQQRMAKLEEMMAAASIDEKIALVENKRADTLSKLVAAATPPAQQTDEMGNPIGAPPQAPDLMGAMGAMRMFPLMYGQPTIELQAEQISDGPPPGMGPDGQPMPPGGIPPMQPGMPADMQPPDQMMPEQMANAGALPVNPMA